MSFLTNMLKPAIKWFIEAQSKKNLPNYNETLELEGLQKNVEIIRDKWAVPHIYAESEADMFFAQGYVHAQERLWQMELVRRVVCGRLSELVGKDALEVDRVARTMGFKYLGEQDAKRFANHELFALMEQYAKGVNAYLKTIQHPPVEFKLLKFKPENWTVADSFGMARMLAVQMSRGWLHELERMGMVGKFGMEKTQEIFPQYPPTNPAALEFGIETNRRNHGRLEAFTGPYLNGLGGSNNWAVAPEKMETGNAALCNDPHLLINTPNIWYENHLVCPDYENTGVSIPGVPLVLIGHNRHIAWGATLTYADVQDTYVEKFTDATCKKYQFGDKVLDATIRTEKIKIKGKQEPHIEQVVNTHHGPVFWDIDATTKISLCTKALQDNEMIVAFYGLNTAKNWNDFVAACQKLTTPSLNLAYADMDNNIGYYMTGEVPIRAQAKGLLPNNGFDGKNEWTGSVPFEQMPHVFNPQQGYFYTCNHKVVKDDFPYDLGKVWMNGYRAKRLDNLLKSKEKFNFQDFAKWQVDFYCSPGLDFIELVKKLKEKPAFDTLTARAKVAADLLLNWDCNLTAETVGGAVYQVLKQELIDIIFEKSTAFRGAITSDKLGIFEMTELFGHDTYTLLRLFQNPSSPWWKNSPENTLAMALQNTEIYLTKTLGLDTKNWKWGNLHRMTAKHALGVKEPLGAILDVGNEPIGGDPDTLCQVSFLPGKHYGGSLIAASYRQLIDMGNLANSQCAAPVGQSGNLKSPHYKDQMQMWLKGEFKPMIWTKEQAKKYQLYQTVLKARK